MVTVSLSSHKAREMGKGGRHGDLSNYVFLTVLGLLRRRRSPDTSTLERMYCMHAIFRLQYM